LGEHPGGAEVAQEAGDRGYGPTGVVEQRGGDLVRHVSAPTGVKRAGEPKSRPTLVAATGLDCKSCVRILLFGAAIRHADLGGATVNPPQRL
jgi:hypothetical protein